MISADDLELLFRTDDPAEAVEIVVRSYGDRAVKTPAEPRKADAQ
jgi:hypothetical protein